MGDTPFQPLRGNATLLTTKATHYARIADAIQRSVTTLRKVDMGDMRSAAISALEGSAGDVADDIERAQNRYKATADALLTYATELSTAQEAADLAIARINEKQEDYDTALAAESTANRAVSDATDTDVSDLEADAENAATARAGAWTALNNAQQEWHDALAMKNEAAARAVDKIQEVVSGAKTNGLEDGWWDDWGSKILDVVKVICEIAGILSIFLAWVPILGQVLLALAALGAIIALVEAIVAVVNGEGSWTDVIFAAVGVVLTVFGGKIAAYLGKLAKFQTVSKFMNKGDDFLNSKAFKKVFNNPKQFFKTGDFRGLWKEGPSFKGMMRDIRNPFSIKTTSVTNAFDDFLRNPIGLKSLGDVPVGRLFQSPWTAAKLGVIVMDARTVISKGQGLWNAGDNLFGGGEHQISVKPEQLLQRGANAVEDKITG